MHVFDAIIRFFSFFSQHLQMCSHPDVLPLVRQHERCLSRIFRHFASLTSRAGAEGLTPTLRAHPYTELPFNVYVGNSVTTDRVLSLDAGPEVPALMTVNDLALFIRVRM